MRRWTCGAWFFVANVFFGLGSAQGRPFIAASVPFIQICRQCRARKKMEQGLNLQLGAGHFIIKIRESWVQYHCPPLEDYNWNSRGPNEDEDGELCKRFEADARTDRKNITNEVHISKVAARRPKGDLDLSEKTSCVRPTFSFLLLLFEFFNKAWASVDLPSSNIMLHELSGDY